MIGTYEAQYKGKTIGGFVNGHEYKIEIDKNVYGYTVSGITDLTDCKGSVACINYASEKSIKRNWIFN